MPTIITRGLGYDEPTIVYRDVASFLVGDLVIEDRVVGIVELRNDAPVGSVTLLPIPVYGVLEPSTALVAVLTSAQLVYGIVSEEGPIVASETNKVVMFIRDDRTLSLSVHTDTGAPVDLTLAKIWFTVKVRTSDPDTMAVFMKRNTAAGGSDAEVKVTDATNGKAEIYIVPDDTADVDPAIYVFDVQVMLANGKTYTIARDKITFKEDVTKTRT